MAMGDMSMTDMSMTDMSMTDMPTATTTAAAATSTAMSMGGMNMGMGDAHSCKISMLWNWNTVDACFLSKSWHIKSTGMFAGSCIGVILLAILLEFLRRSVKEYDRYLIRANAKNDNFVAVTRNGMNGTHKGSDQEARGDAGLEEAGTGNSSAVSPAGAPIVSTGYRPKIYEQAIRALLHTVQFIVAYFLMLLAMYYNGYFIICIFIGAYIGSFVFQWEKLGGGQQTSAAGEATVCCG
ncbi:Ctr copper transporter family-domain-containing protein [Hypoxylon sp. FL0890]|nr:Ctr copper transporter family-domain-containing protein [Hypoxylon sp. FL0890]